MSEKNDKELYLNFDEYIRQEVDKLLDEYYEEET